MWVPPKFSSKFHRSTRLQTPSRNQSCSFHHTRRRSLLCPQGMYRTQVHAFRHLFCQAPSRRLILSCVLHLLLQVNGVKMKQRKCLEVGHLPFCSCFIFFSFCKWIFLIKRERAYFHSSPHRDFGLIPGTAEPGGLPSMGLHRVGHNWRDLAAAAAAAVYICQSQRKKQMSDINAYMWNPEKWYRWTYLQSRNRKQMYKHQGGKGWWWWEIGT